MLKKFLKKIYFRLFIRISRLKNENEFQFSYRKDIFRYYIKEHDKKLTSEEKNALKYLKNNVIHYFPYTFKDNFNSDRISVLNDDDKNLKYVIHDNKRLYFKKSWSDQKIRQYYNFLLIEQNDDSPHRYLTYNFNVNAGYTVLDVGAAEGNFALSIIEKSKKVIIFEADEEWIEPLTATFDPWKEKVEIVNKFVADSTDEKIVKLDDFVKEPVDFIKADIEGNENRLLRGAENILKKYRPQIVVCTYHRSNDAEKIETLLKNFSYRTEFSKGVMIFMDDPTPPYLRKALIRAKI